MLASRGQPTDFVRQHQFFAFGSLLCLSRKHHQLLLAMSSATKLSLPFGTCHDSNPSSGCSKKWDQEVKATTTNGMVARGLPDPDRSIGCHRTQARSLVVENSGWKAEGQRFPVREPPGKQAIDSRCVAPVRNRRITLPFLRPWLFNLRLGWQNSDSEETAGSFGGNLLLALEFLAFEGGSPPKASRGVGEPFSEADYSRDGRGKAAR
jgi:hypothetical protein